ncbi:catalase [Reyranella sp.]|uniref:catalase n=1 Tax=Reyranella sp. TaxID=1929291 RepID=UPI0027308E95|nr:catalase [Reyranella sp.]MDP2373481.1 catalase [Reyranella sp.]
MKKAKRQTENTIGGGKGGETHQTTVSAKATLTTNQGVAISDNQNSLKSGVRGPTLLEDFVLREKITHFDHERIPERIVHARGSGAHGYFQPLKNLSRLTKAAFLQDPKKPTKVFVRFSTVAGGAGSVDTPRDVRGFAVKFYTEEGNFDLVGNNIPVFFIQDAMKFPDLVHAVKMEPDRGFPQAASAHDNFWDFVSLMPESMHMLMWAMSDRTIPRSLRHIEGFGVHTFRLVNAKDESTFVKFHWRPSRGAASTLWDEAVKIAGADPDFTRRDLWEAIDGGDFPEWTLSIQAFDQATADKLDFDILDPTKLIPEEVIPLTPIGRLVLNENPVNFFAETEQVAFHPGHLVPGIDFTPDPLLQGRLHSYIDTQLSRLGGPNFHEIPINRPVCPMRNFQRDGHMRMQVPPGRVNYEPNSLDPDSPRENQLKGFASFPDPNAGPKLRQRPESFADHYSQARQFWRSMTPPEQGHIVGAFTFELSKVETVAIRRRMLGHLDLIEPELGARVAAAMNMKGEALKIVPAVVPRDDLDPSPALSLIAKAPATIKGRCMAALVTEGSDAKAVDRLRQALDKEGAKLKLIAPKIGKMANGLVPDQTVEGGPSVLFDAVVLLPSESGAKDLLGMAAAVNWVRDAFGHLKAIGFNDAAKPLLDKAGGAPDDKLGVISFEAGRGLESFIATAKKHKVWDREKLVQPPR